MQMRRADDRTVNLVLASPTGWMGAESVARFFATSSHVRSPAALTPEPWREELAGECREGAEVVVVLDGEGDDVLLMAGSATPCRIPRGRVENQDVAALGIAAWRQERERNRRRHHLPDRLIAFFEALNRAEAPEEVYAAMTAHALRIVGAHRAAVLLRTAEGRLRSGPAPSTPAWEAVDAPWHERFSHAGLVSVVDVAPGKPLSGLAPLFGEPGTCQMAHVPFGGEGVLVLTERRDDRIFEAEDWDLLRVLALQGEMALKRLRLIEDVRSLSLTDPLTGLGNRRHLDAVLQHAWAASQRGEPLSVLVLDLDGFKEVNDVHGHHTGDHLLGVVAECLRREARGSDVAVRYGGDEFMVILPGGDASGARALARRLRERLHERLGGLIRFSEGVAEVWPGCRSTDELIHAADQSLYDTKRRRAGQSPAAFNDDVVGDAVSA